MGTSSQMYHDRDQDSHLTPPLIVCQSSATLQQQTNEIKSAMQNRGFCVIEAWDAEYTTLKIVSKMFGDIQSHIRANADGIVGEGVSADPSWKQFATEYQGITDEEFYPHTDGSFLDGVISTDRGLMRVGPPKYVILQCVRSASSGGTNIIIDSQQVFIDIVHKRPEMAKILLSPKCITFCRDDQLALDYPVYQQISDNLFRVRYRFDSKALAPSWSFAAVEALHHEYHINPEFVVRVDLQPGQILIADNFRVLHGREAFFSNGEPTKTRQLRRVWINDDKAMMLKNIAGAQSTPRALATYTAYGVVKNEIPGTVESLSLEAGIRVPANVMARIKALFEEPGLARQLG